MTQGPTLRAGMALAGVLALLAAAPVQAQVLGKDAVVIGMTLEPPVLDPTINPAAAIGEITQLNIYEGLTRIDERGAVLPGLAERWDVSGDGRTYTFFLRRGVVFSDGTAFDSGDVKFTFVRNAAADSTNSRKSYFTQMERIDTPDPYTVAITLKDPSGLFLFNMAEKESVILAPETAATDRTKPVGTGPFQLERWVPGDQVVLVKNPRYRDAGTVRLNRVVFKFINDAAAQIAALRAGDVDAFPNLAAVETAAQFAKDVRFKVMTGTTEGETILAINNKRGPLANVLVRRALSLAVNRDEVNLGAVFGYGVPIGSHFAPHHQAYVDLTGLYAYDPERAKALLREAGYPNGFEASLTLPPTTYARLSGQIIAAELAKVGVKLKIEEVEWARWLDAVYTQKNYDLTIVSHVEPMDIGIYADPNYYFQYDNAAFRDIMARANRATDPATQNRLWGDAQRKLAEDAVNVFLFELPKVGVARAGLEGLWANQPMFINDIAALRWQ